MQDVVRTRQRLARGRDWLTQTIDLINPSYLSDLLRLTPFSSLLCTPAEPFPCSSLAEARAARILHGLGFDKAMQAKKTKVRAMRHGSSDLHYRFTPAACTHGCYALSLVLTFSFLLLFLALTGL